MQKLVSTVKNAVWGRKMTQYLRELAPLPEVLGNAINQLFSGQLIIISFKNPL